MNNAEKLKSIFESELAAHFAVPAEKAAPYMIHAALARAVMALSADGFEAAQRVGERRAYYLSAEFLIGRSVFNNLFNLGLLGDARAMLESVGQPLERLEEIEDAALGNGGLGRLAACYLESAATLNLPLDGYGIRYKYGLFRQRFEDGFQRELPDDWQKSLDPWSFRRDDLAQPMVLCGQDVLAVPYDMPVYGYRSARVGRLRLWQCEASEPFDFQAFDSGDYSRAQSSRAFADSIHMVLYPNDNGADGKRLRLMQQYFFAGASVRDMLREFAAAHGGDMSRLADFCAAQLNDTHPVVAIPEMIHLLTARHGMDFDAAFEQARRVFSYTNHTIMAEALEKWDTALFRRVLPHLLPVVRRMQKKLDEDLKRRAIPANAAATYALAGGGRVNMANIAVFASSCTNGVAELHTEILRKDVLAQWFALYPERFQNKTNGVTQRRWLGLCNPELSECLTRALGSDAWLTDLYALRALSRMAGDPALMASFRRIKTEKKRQLAAYVARAEGILLNPDAIFDVQIKRLHEYKRQLMAALSILWLYFGIRDGSVADFHPMAFIFGAKSAPGYFRAKAIIKLINEISKLVAEDPATRDLIPVAFVQNYNVSYAERIIPAADVSEQISTAGTEASGTGNMKLMLNGAVTIGTYDGANIEIVKEAGPENNYIFGARVEDLRAIRDSYDPKAVCAADARVRRVVDALTDGTLSDGGTGMFAELRAALLEGASWHAPDHYFVLLDLPAYVETKLRLNRDYRDRDAFSAKALLNIAAAGKFSSDRSVAEYARDIWRVGAVE